MSAHLSDARRVDRLIIVALFADIVRQGSSRINGKVERETLLRLRAVQTELEAPLTDKAHGAIHRRAKAGLAIFDKWRIPGTPVAEFGVIAYHFVRRLIDEGAIVIGEESDLGEALDAILPGLQPAADDDALYDRTYDRASRTLQALRDKGYFRDGA